MTLAFEKSRAKKFSETNNQSTSVPIMFTFITPKHAQLKTRVVWFVELRKRKERWGEGNLTNGEKKVS